jgi:hypothetical protein
MADEQSQQMMALAGLKPRVDSANSRNPMQFIPTSSNSTKNATNASGQSSNAYAKSSIQTVQ